MRMQLWRLATVSSMCLITTACLTTSKPSPKDAPEFVAKTAAEAKAEWCRGQTPAPFAQADFDAAPQWARDYVTGNMRQWRDGGC